MSPPAKPRTAADRRICELRVWHKRFCALLKGARQEKCVFLLTSTYMDVGKLEVNEQITRRDCFALSRTVDIHIAVRGSIVGIGPPIWRAGLSERSGQAGSRTPSLKYSIYMEMIN